uniref:FBD domain-containing protein n=1 Tax=Leersia perrieri TaxID=77586 RepID=A0A0D9UXU5_9ORYZ
MSTLKLTVDKLGSTIQVDGLMSLKKSADRVIGSKIPHAKNHGIVTLELELPTSTNSYDLFQAVKPDYLLQLFASINEVKFAPRFSREMMHTLILCTTSNRFTSCLRKVLVHLPPLNGIPLLEPLFSSCAPSCEVTILFHADSSDDIRLVVKSFWILRFPEIRWLWGTWN